MNDKYLYQFKITLLEVEPPIWRRVQVDNYMTLRRCGVE